MKKLYVIIVGAVFLAINLFSTTNVFATESLNSNNYSMSYLEDGITIIDNSLLNSSFDISQLSINDMPLRAPRYKVQDVKNLGTYVDYSRSFGTVSGNKGVTINLSKSISVSSSISSSFGASYGQVSSAVGFNVSSSSTLTYSGSYKVPSNVSRAELIAYPLYQRYQYSVYLKGKSWIKDTKLGVGYAYKPIGIHYNKKIIK